MSKDRLIDRLRVSRRNVLRPPKLMQVDEWADTYRRMSSAESSTPGPFLTSRVEVCRGVLQAAQEEGVREISVMSATQLLKTTVIENVFGYHAHLDPGPIMIVQPTQELADAFVKEKLTPMIRNTPALVEAFGGPDAIHARTSDNTIKRKKFRGGAVTIVTAGTPTNFAMRAIRILLLDEIDKYPETKEGSGVALAMERLETFSHNSLVVKVCSPTVTGKSAIAEAYEKSDQRRAYVPCPYCGHEDWLRWKNVVFASEDKPGLPRWKTAGYCCAECGVVWTEQERIRALTTRGGVMWRQTKKFQCCGADEQNGIEAPVQDPQVERKWNGQGQALCRECGERGVSNHHAGFHASCLYGTRKDLSLDVRKFLEAKGNRAELRTFINTRLAETFEDDTQLESVQLDTDTLKGRTEPRWSRVPEGAVVLTAGVDVQDDRLEVEVVAWGHGDESWSLGYHVIAIEPSDDEAWVELDKILLAGHEREDGTTLYVQGVCVDSGGHHTQTVYAYCAARRNRRVFPIKGGGETGQRSPLWPTNKVIPVGKPYILGTNAAKDKIEAHMRVSVPGPGYMHVPADRAESWFKMMTSEKREVFYEKGQRRTAWKTLYNGIRNEALDCRVYALAALEMLRKFKVITPRSLVPAGAAVAPPHSAAATSAPSPAPVPVKKTTRPPRPPRQGGFGSGGGFGGGGRGEFGGFGGRR